MCKEKKEENSNKWIEIWNKIKKYVYVVVGIILVLVIIANALRKGVESANAAYKVARDQTEGEQRKESYHLGYDAAESYNHVSNRGAISIESVKEVAELEVLEVSDVEFVFQGADENNENISIWLEVPGTGIFTANLQASEFIVDSERNYILVRVPELELRECKIDYAGVNTLRFENDVFNDSIATGENMAREMLKDGYLLIQKEFASNERYYSSAETAAENLIVNMVKELNPNVSNLQVEVEFMK